MMKDTMIPKIIHAVWVGPCEMGKVQQECIASWKRYLPEREWEYRFWNEKNIPREVWKHPYVKSMYAKKKWAFIADYVRFWALAHDGGIYLDTDQEVLKPLDDLLSHSCFFGETSSDGFISAGIIGAERDNSFIKEIFSVYDARSGGEHDTSPQTITAVYSKVGRENTVTIYEPKFFYPCNAGERCTQEKLASAYTTHHWAESWVPFAGVRKILRRIGVWRILRYVRLKN